MLESDVSVGDTCKEIGVVRHGSDNADKVQKHNAEDLFVNRNFELSPRQIVCRRLNTGQSTVSARVGLSYDPLRFSPRSTICFIPPAITSLLGLRLEDTTIKLIDTVMLTNIHDK